MSLAFLSKLFIAVNIVKEHVDYSNCQKSIYFQREVSGESYIHYLDLEAGQSRHRGKECYLLPTIVKRGQCEIHPQSTSWYIALKCLDMPLIRNTSDKYLSHKHIWNYTCQRKAWENYRCFCNSIILALCLRGYQYH